MAQLSVSHAAMAARSGMGVASLLWFGIRVGRCKKRVFFYEGRYD
jgi:hypothetical protein